ncbi:hypothetical protein ACQ4PT_002372 [Festuca glaucescens]
MEANGIGDHELPNGVGDHALPNGVGDHELPNGVAGHALANGGGQANHALANGAGDHALADHALANGALENGGAHVLANGVVPAQAVATADVLYPVFLRLPAQEIARCRRVCRLWRHITGTFDFRRDHQRHSYRTLMPLVFCQEPGGRWHLRAADMLDGVPRSRPVFRLPLHNASLKIHGSCAGILLLSSGNRLYACNPCTRRWACLPPLHVNHRIIGFYATGVYDETGTDCYVLYDDGPEYDCVYWIFRVDAYAAARYIGRPVAGEGVGLDLVLANGIAPSYAIPPVHFLVYLCWLPRAAQGTSGILIFNTAAESFRLIPPPSFQVDGELFPVGVGSQSQLFVLHEHLAMTVISPTGAVDVWVRNDTTGLWSRPYRIGLPVDAVNQGVFAVARDRSGLMQCPRILHTGDWFFLSMHTIQESLLLHPDILPLQDTDAVDGDPPFFHNQ